jgi:hypothetical protein
MEENEEMNRLFNLNEIDNKIKLSYSKISSFDKNGPLALVKKIEVENDGITIGSLTDDLLNDFVNKTSIFKEKYYIYNGTKPTATLGSLCDIILKNYKEIPSKDVILEIIKENKYWSSTVKPEVLDGKYNTKEFWDYLKAQYASNKQVLVTQDDIVWAQDLVDTLLSHKNSKHIFNGDKNEELYNQIYFEYDYDIFKFRGILDILSINHKNKTIQMIDLKTGGNPVSEFVSSFIKWRYYIQEAVYTKAIDIIIKQFKLEEYKVLPFQFLYISRFEKIPFIFEVTEKWHNAALNGFKTSFGWEYKGLNELLDDIKWHFNNKIFDISKEIYESNGKMNLKDEFITINNG